MALRTVARVSVGPGTTVVSFVEGDLTVTSYVVQGSLVAQSDNSTLPFNPETDVTLKTVSGFTVTSGVAAWFEAVVSSYGAAADDPSLEANAIVTLAQVKAYLNIETGDTSKDSFLRSKINVVSEWIERETNSKIILQDMTEVVDGEGYYDYDAPSKPVYRIGIDSGMAAPIASDGFSAATTDGLGHTQTEFIGTGGSALTWVVPTQAFARTGGLAKSTVDGDALEYVETSETDVIAQAKLTIVVAKKLGLVLRWSSATNYILVYHNGTQVKLDKVIGGTTTNLLSETATYVAGAVLKAVCDGVKYRVYYNGTQAGDEVYIHNLTTATKFGIYAEAQDADNYIDNFAVFSRLDAVQFRDSVEDAWERVETATPANLYVSSGGCYLNSDESVFPSGKSNVLIHYVAGYSPVPKKLEEIAIEAVAQIYNESPVGGGAINGSGGSFNQTGGSISGGSVDLGVLNGLRARFRHELDTFTYGRVGERL